MAANDMKRDASTGISIVVVGGGIGGLTAAIECHRKGHGVHVYERRKTYDTFSDIMRLGSSAQRGMLNWPGFLPRLLEKAVPPQLVYYKQDGTRVVVVGEEPTKEGLNQFTVWRRKLHEELYRYAAEVGIKIVFGKKATRYLEADEKGGVEFEDGEVVHADLVVAADGIGSRSTELVVKDPETPTSSGYAIFRVSFPLDHACQDPLVRDKWGGPEEQGLEIWLAENIHIVISKSVKTNQICWMMTHKDNEHTASESWSADCPATHALPFVPESEGWAPCLAALIKRTPGNRCVNWKLVWRSPHRQWSSPGHRVLQLGDSCHPFLPTSGAGAVMAIEDAYSLATCLALGGKDDVPLGVRVHNKLRFERVSFAQRMGFENREVFHHPDWEKLAKDSSTLTQIGYNRWLTEHDTEEYTYANFERCKAHLLHGEHFENTNLPPGKKYEPWTVQGLIEEAERNNRGFKT